MQTQALQSQTADGNWQYQRPNSIAMCNFHKIEQKYIEITITESIKQKSVNTVISNEMYPIEMYNTVMFKKVKNL